MGVHVSFLAGVLGMDRKTISSAPPSESEPEGTFEKRVREEDLEAEAETRTGVWEWRGHWRCTKGSGLSDSSTKREL